MENIIYNYIDQPLKQGYSTRLDWLNVPEDMGIYRIFNIYTNKSYIGASSNIRKRIQMHFSKLKRRKHNSIELSRDVNENSIYDFAYQILEFTNLLDDREQYWCKLYIENTYNKRINPSTNKGNILSKESRIKMGKNVSKALKGKTPKNLSEIRVLQRRGIIEYKNGVFNREYRSCKEAGEILSVCYKKLNYKICCLYKGKSQTPFSQYPDLTWDYIDKKPPRKVKR